MCTASLHRPWLALLGRADMQNWLFPLASAGLCIEVKLTHQ